MKSRNIPEFSPFRFLSGGHVQTIVSHLLPIQQMSDDFKVWMIPVGDGDELFCRFYKRSDKNLTIFFHGLGGTADSKYLQVSGQAALNKGHSVLLINHRGAGEGLKFAKGIYHSGVVQDVENVIKFARLRMPEAKITACGFSLSANLLLNFAGQSSKNLPDEIIAINPPIDLHTTAAQLLRPSNFLYDQKFVRDLKIIFREKVRVGTMDKYPVLPKFCRLVDIDDAVTAPIGGFKSREDYYTKCSSMHYGSNITVPTYILTAEDDPFIPADSFRKTKYSSSVHLNIVPKGGHCGYLAQPGGGMRWLGDFFAAALD